MTKAEARAMALSFASDAVCQEGGWLIELAQRRGRLSDDDAAVVRRQLGVVMVWLDRRADKALAKTAEAVGQ